MLDGKQYLSGTRHWLYNANKNYGLLIIMINYLDVQRLTLTLSRCFQGEEQSASGKGGGYCGPGRGSSPNGGAPVSYKDVCVGTSVATITEPDCLGPCEPGSSVTLEGIVWHETQGGSYLQLLTSYQYLLLHTQIRFCCSTLISNFGYNIQTFMLTAT